MSIARLERMYVVLWMLYNIVKTEDKVVFAGKDNKAFVLAGGWAVAGIGIRCCNKINNQQYQASSQLQRWIVPITHMLVTIHLHCEAGSSPAFSSEATRNKKSDSRHLYLALPYSSDTSRLSLPIHHCL